MAHLHVVRVFLDQAGEGGNPLGVFLDAHRLPDAARQRIAADLGFSETVFVDDAQRGIVRIFTPAAELPFAGHPLVGTSWLLRTIGTGVDVLRPPAGEVPTWTDGELTWIRGRAEWVPEMELMQFPAVADVDDLTGATERVGVLYAWAWEDEDAGRVRVRMFAPSLGIPEDEATGAGALKLAALVGRPIEVRQGVGSILLARPGPDRWTDVGGRCAHVEEREYY